MSKKSDAHLTGNPQKKIIIIIIIFKKKLKIVECECCGVECCGVLWSVVECCGVLWSVVECCGVLWSVVLELVCVCGVERRYGQVARQPLRKR